MNKTDIRNYFIEQRSDLSKPELIAKNAAIQTLVTATIDWPAMRTAHTYRSVATWNEVDTAWLQGYVSKHWPGLALSIGNPSRSTSLLSAPFDVVFVPLLAFDDRLNRIGFGGGWYDRFLAGQPSALKVGLAYDVQQADSLPNQSHDIPMDIIITETRVLRK